jgi:hypothetical protein
MIRVCIFVQSVTLGENVYYKCFQTNCLGKYLKLRDAVNADWMTLHNMELHDFCRTCIVREVKVKKLGGLYM